MEIKVGKGKEGKAIKGRRYEGKDDKVAVQE